jgi:hypothetical protein
MREFFEKNKWAAVLLAISAVALAVFSAVRNLNLMPAKRLSLQESLKQEEVSHQNIQKELQEKYGIAPKKWGLPPTAGASGAGAAGTPIPVKPDPPKEPHVKGQVGNE